MMLGMGSAHGQIGLRDMEFGLNVGGMNYIGDLNKQKMTGKMNLGYGAFYRCNFENRWGLVVEGCYGKIEGGNPDVYAWRGLSFSSFVAEASVRVEFNFLPFGMREDQWRWTPYIYGGMGAFMFNPQAQWTDPETGAVEWIDLQPLGTEGQGTEEYPDRMKYSLMEKMMPFGLGVKLKPFDAVTLAVEYGFRKTWTDYIDDVSLTYVGSDLLETYGGSLAAAMADPSGHNWPAGYRRGDDSLDDWYAYLNVSATIRLDKLFWFAMKKRCDLKH